MCVCECVSVCMFHGHRFCTCTYLGAVEARQQPLVGDAAVVHLSNLGQAVKVSIHADVIVLAEARHDDLIMQVTLFVH